MIIARRVLPPCVFLDLLCHPVPYRRYSRRHPYRCHSNPSVEFKQEASVAQTTSECAQTRSTSLRQEVLGSRRNPVWHRRSLPSSRRGFESILDTLLTNSPILPRPEAPKGFRR